MQEAVGVLRRGSCYSDCNRRESVLEVVDELHQAQFYGFLELCRKEPATHHALHLAKVILRKLLDPTSGSEAIGDLHVTTDARA